MFVLRIDVTRREPVCIFVYLKICGIFTIKRKNDEGHHTEYNRFLINASQAQKGWCVSVKQEVFFFPLSFMWKTQR